MWTDEAILAQLVGAAADGRALSVAGWRAAGHRPSATVVISRFGSWSAACLAAGLVTARSPGGWRHRTPDRALVEAVAAFLAEPSPGSRDRGGVRAYAAWAKRTGAPSAAVLRGRFGSWSAVKALAVANLRGNGAL
jgi:hypothetical protein